MNIQTSGVHESEEFWNKFTASASIHPANLYRYNLIASYIAALDGSKKRIVDLGCGNGELLRYLHEKQVGEQYWGFDGSSAIVERNRRAHKFADFAQADLQRPDLFPTGLNADVVICSEVVEHMPNYLPAFAIAELSLRPRGLFIATTQGGKRRRHDIELLGHLRHYDIDQLALKIQEAGFTIIKKQKLGWPILNMQKVAASMFMGQVSKELASHSNPSLLFRFACKCVGVGLKFSSTNHGPQLLVCAEKCSS